MISSRYTPPFCPICHSKTEKPAARQIDNGYTIFYCDVCDLTFASPMEAATKEWYENSPIYNSVDATSSYKYVNTDIRIKKLISILKNIHPDKIKLLDVGCGEGKLLASLKDYGISNLYGVDINSRSVLKAKERGLENVFQKNFSQLTEAFPENSFDCIVCFEVLEHSSEPLKLLNDIRQLLKKDGLLFLTVPNLNRLPAFFDEDLGYPPHHLTLWSTKAIKRALEMSGFHSIETEIKPLDVSEFLFHIVRKVKKIRNRFFFTKEQNNFVNDDIYDNRELKEIYYKKNIHIFRVAIWKIVFVVSSLLVIFLRFIFKDGGFTIIASARKT